MNTETLAHGWDWATIDAMKGTVVDVGGARGAVAVCLAKHYPNIKFIVQDFADVVEGGAENLPESMKGQIEFMAASCLEEQPVKHKEVYFMRAVLHNWPDGYCVKILKNLLPGEYAPKHVYKGQERLKIKALKKGSHILVNDIILWEPGSLPPYTEKLER